MSNRLSAQHAALWNRPSSFVACSPVECKKSCPSPESPRAVPRHKRSARESRVHCQKSSHAAKISGFRSTARPRRKRSCLVEQAIVFRGLGRWAVGPRAVMKTGAVQCECGTDDRCLSSVSPRSGVLPGFSMVPVECKTPTQIRSACVQQTLTSEAIRGSRYPRQKSTLIEAS